MLVLLLGLQEQGTGPLCISGLHKGQRTRRKVTLTFLKNRHMIDLVFNLCVHLPCWGSKIRRGKCLAMAWPQVHQHLALPHHCSMQHTPWPSNWWTRSPNLPGLAPFCYPLHCLCCAMEKHGETGCSHWRLPCAGVCPLPPPTPQCRTDLIPLMSFKWTNT